MRREVFEELGGFVETFRGMYEDRVFFTKVSLKLAVFVSDVCWVKYRQHPASSCAIAEKTGDVDSAWPSYLIWVEPFLTEQGVRDKWVRKALNRAFRLYGYQNSYGIVGLIHRPRWSIQGVLIWTALGIAKWTLTGPAYRWLQMKRGVMLLDVTRA